MKVYKKALAWFVCLTMLFTMSTGITFATDMDADANAVDNSEAVVQQLDDVESNDVDTADVEEAEPAAKAMDAEETASGSIELISGDKKVVVTADKIKAATSETATADNPWTNAKGGAYVGTFYSLKSILETAGIDYEGAHGMKTVATDGFVNGFTLNEIDNVYIYDQGEVTKDGEAVGAAGTYGTAINGSEVAGNKWAKSIATVEIAFDHVWFVKNDKCKHYCSICGEAEPAALTVTCDDKDYPIYECEIEEALGSVSSVEATEENFWTNAKGNKYVGTFYSLKSIITDTLGISVEDDIHGVLTTASDGYMNGYTVEELDKLYIYDQGEVTKDGEAVGAAGTYGTAINGKDVYGNKWAKSVVNIKLTDSHMPFVKGGKPSTYCTICGEEIFEVGDVYYTLQELVDAAEAVDGVKTVTINRDVDFGDGVEIDAGDNTVNLDLAGNKMTAGKLTVKNGTVNVSGGTFIGELGENVIAAGGSFSVEVPAENCAKDMVPVYNSETGLYEMKAASAYESQKTANELTKTIEKLSDQLAEMAAQVNQLNAVIQVNDIAVKAKATATSYKAVTFTWEANQAGVLFKVEKKINGVWTEIKPTAVGKYSDSAEPGIANQYRVAAGVKYKGLDNEELVQYGKYVTASATPGIGKVATPKVTTKSKKLTVKWSAVAGADSYDVYVGTNSAVTKGLVKYNNVKSLSKVTKKLKKNKKYYVKVRAHVKNSAGKAVYGSWSSAKKIKCK